MVIPNMKATLEFQLPEEQSDFKLAQLGSDLHVFVKDLDNELRSYLKHGHQFKTPDEVMEHIRNLIVGENIPSL